MRAQRSCPLAVLLVLALGRGGRAELPQVRLDRISPLGGGAGAPVMLKVEGRDLEDVNALHFNHPGLKAELVKPNEFRVTIAAEVPPGAYDVRAVGRYGISGGRLFEVSRGLAEVLEAEPNDTPEKAQAIPLNAAVNGQSDGNGDDFFRFPARNGRRIVIDCEALRLDSALRGTLSLATAGGKELLQSRPYYDRTDPLLDVVIPGDGDYVLRLHDATYAGGHPYRVLVTDRPHLENAWPVAVVPGETVELTVFGRNLPGGHPVPGAVVLGLPLEQVAVPFTAPGAADSFKGMAWVHPYASASLNARGYRVRPRGLEDAVNAVTLVAAMSPPTLEREPNDTSSSAQELKLPTVVSGRLDRPGDADWYRLRARAGEEIAVDLACERIGGPGILRVIVLNDKGNEIANIDDHGITFNALAMYNRDPFGRFTAPADGEYRLLVQDTYNNGGPRFVYALRVGKPGPDFAPVVVHESPNEPTAPVVRQGGAAHLDFCLNRRDGFSGPVTVEAEGLPPGVSCPPVHVSPQTEFSPVVFEASSDAPEWAGAIRLRAWATVGGARLERPVRASQRRWPIANINTSREAPEICLAVRPKAPYGLRLPPEPKSVAAGGTLETVVRVERHWPEFQGKVQVNGLTLPPGFSIPTAELPEGKTEAPVRISVASNVPPGSYTVVLRGDAQVPFNRDPKATSKPNVRVADPSTPLTVVVTPAPKP